MKARTERASGLSLDDVRVHYNSPEPETIRSHAFARGADIHLAPGQERHLPHEAWHMVQQKQGRVAPTTRVGGMAVNDDAGLEREADAGRLDPGASATSVPTPPLFRTTPVVQRVAIGTKKYTDAKLLAAALGVATPNARQINVLTLYMKDNPHQTFASVAEAKRDAALNSIIQTLMHGSFNYSDALEVAGEDSEGEYETSIAGSLGRQRQSNLRTHGAFVKSKMDTNVLNYNVILLYRDEAGNSQVVDQMGRYDWQSGENDKK